MKGLPKKNMPKLIVDFFFLYNPYGNIEVCLRFKCQKLQKPLIDSRFVNDCNKSNAAHVEIHASV